MTMASSRPGNRAVLSWCFFDFANSAFTTLVVTFIYATYFTKRIAEDEISGTALWSRGISLTAIIVAVLSPFLGAVADRGGHRKRFLVVTTLITLVGCCLLYTVKPGQVFWGLTWFILSNVCYEIGLVFYNAYLPDLVNRDKIGRVSGYGWAFGYLGGLLCLVIALVGFVQPESPWFGLSRDEDQNLRATNLLVAVWFFVGSLPLFFFLRLPEKKRTGGGKGWSGGLTALRQTMTHVRRYRQVVRLLVARLLYNDGLITIFAFGGIYAQAQFGFSDTEILVFGIVINVAAGIGSFALGFLDDWLGGKKTILISLAGLMGAGLLAVFAPWAWAFWIAGLLVGIFSGPNQAASRSLLGRFVPPDKENEFYGFFAFSGKATAFLGPLLLGVFTDVFQSHRVGMSVVLLFFLAGGILLFAVDEQEGIVASQTAPDS